MATLPRSSQATLLFQHPNRKVRRAPLREYWQTLAGTLGTRRDLTSLITTDAVLRDLNGRFRHKDQATDVLSFDGEIAVSFDRAAEQAAEIGHSVDDELRILMLHGALHLMGLDHETDKGEMRRTETYWRKKLGLPHGLIERAAK